MKRPGVKHVAGILLVIVSLIAEVSGSAVGKPNILVIFGDDVGITNISAYGQGVVGYRTPNLDKLAKEGLMFTDYYAENSCAAGRATFITGQCAKRTGLSKVGIPGAPVGLQDWALLSNPLTITTRSMAEAWHTPRAGIQGNFMLAILQVVA